MAYDNIKSHKKPGLQPFSGRYIVENCASWKFFSMIINEYIEIYDKNLLSFAFFFY